MAQIDVMKLLQDPVFQIGMGMMGTPGSFNQVVSGGTQQALANLQAFEQQRLAKEKADRERQVFEMERQQYQAEQAMQAEKLKAISNFDGTKESARNLVMRGIWKPEQYKALFPEDSSFVEKWTYAQQASPEELKKAKDSGLFGGTKVDINLNEEGGAYRKLTEKEKQDLGFKANENPYIDKTGTIKLPPTTPAEKMRMESFASRMKTSFENINTLMQQNPMEFQSMGGRISATVMEAATTGAWWSGLAQSTANDQEKMLITDYLQFINAARGYASGAAVPETEVKRDASVYMPKPGDTPEVVQYRMKKMQEAYNDIIGLKNLTPIELEEHREKLNKKHIEAAKEIERMNTKRKVINDPEIGSYTIERIE